MPAHPFYDKSDVPTDTDQQVAPPPELRDPAEIAASVLLHHAFTAESLTLDDVRRDGMVALFIVPSEIWTAEVFAVWKARVRDGKRESQGFRNLRYRDGEWTAWAPEEAVRPSCLSDAGDTFAKAIADGHHCAAFTADLTWLPPELVSGADVTLHLPKLCGADVLTVARLLCGAMAAGPVSDEQAAALTPRLLRLARRPGQAAEAYVSKLLGLLEAQREASPVVVAPKPKLSPRDTPTLARLHGMDAAVQWGMTVKVDLEAFKTGTLEWADVDRGCLLSGPPGCGKTLFARALAESCGVPLITGSYGQWLGSGQAHQGDLLKGMRKTFNDARNKAPSILFIDEVDSFPNRATITHHYADWEIQVVNTLLAEIDGVDGREGVILLAACNHPNKLDPALVRSGRLDRHIRIGLPDTVALSRILREHLNSDLADEDLSGAALSALGSTGADCERLVRGARRRAREASRAMVVTDLLAEINGSDDRPLADLWRTAIHEAGHAIASCELMPGALQAITLLNTAGAGGATMSAGVTGSCLLATDVHRRLVFLLSGRAAEELVLGHPSSGAGGSSQSDIAIATGTAVRAAASLGLDEVLGPIWLGETDPNDLRAMLGYNPVLASQVSSALELAYEDALSRLRGRSSCLAAIASSLIARRVLTGADVIAIIERDATGLADGTRA